MKKPLKQVRFALRGFKLVQSYWSKTESFCISLIVNLTNNLIHSKITKII